MVRVGFSSWRTVLDNWVYQLPDAMKFYFHRAVDVDVTSFSLIQSAGYACTASFPEMQVWELSPQTAAIC